MDKINTVIIGAGFSGLSAGHKLGKNYIIVEKDSRPGGFAKSEKVHGFTFDYTGHLLHFRDDRAKKFILNNVKIKMNILKRNAFIYSCGVFTDYPYQTNMFGLPPRIIEENLIGFLYSKKGCSAKENFYKWVMSTFGNGIARNFMLPYNKKLWKFKLDKLTINWLGRFVPVPTVDDIFRGITPTRVETGYNVVFYYPQKGGIESVIKDIYQKVKKNVRLNSEVKSINLKNRILYLNNNEKVHYNSIVSSMNLRQFIKITGDRNLMRLASKLKAVSVYALNIGYKDSDKNSRHWIYFPEKKYPFYRIGFFTGFSKFNAPAGMSSVFVETSFKTHLPALLDIKIINHLIDLGIIKSRRDIKLIYPLILKDAYVLFDKDRENVLPEIKQYLRRFNVFLAGRWAKWEYSSMEDAILDGFDAAEKILGGSKNSYGN